MAVSDLEGSEAGEVTSISIATPLPEALEKARARAAECGYPNAEVCYVPTKVYGIHNAYLVGWYQPGRSAATDD
jgi:hypothetical protein